MSMLKLATLFSMLSLAAGYSTGCTSVHLGATEPTSQTYRLRLSDRREAAAVDCRQTWVTGNPVADIDAARQHLRRQGVRIATGNPQSLGTALRGVLWVSKDFNAMPEEDRAELLTHELVHYCDRARLGDAVFDARYATSNGRWVFETRAYAQSFATLAAMGLSPERIDAHVRSRLAHLPDRYALWDIDPVQYQEATAKIWYDVFR